MKHFSRKLATAIIAVCLYIGLYYVATTTSSLSPTIRYILLFGLPLLSAIFTLVVLLYSLWATAKYRNTPSLLLVIMSLFVSVFLVPIWLIIAQQHYTRLKAFKRAEEPQQQVEKPASKETAPEDLVPSPEPTPEQKPQEELPEQKSDATVVVEQNNDASNAIIHQKSNKPGKVRSIKSKKELDTLIAQNPRGLIVKFSADAWCEPCKVAKPIYEKVARKFGGDIPFLVANFDSFQGSSAMKINEVPTFIVYKEGKEVNRFTYKGEDRVAAMLEQEVQKLLGK